MQSSMSSARAAALWLLAASAGCGYDERVPSTAAPSLAPSVGAGGAAPSEAAASEAPASVLASGPRPLDLLFVVDNSRSMGDAQGLLVQISNVLDRFIQPLCVDDAGNQFPAPAAGADCAAGQRRQFEPVQDAHLGVITTSLGDGGAESACPEAVSSRLYVEDRIDNGHLIGALPRGRAAGADTNFVRWRAGEDPAAAAESFGKLVVAVGENGCGWEMPLEAWYRFLVDRRPYAQLEQVDCAGQTAGVQDCVQPVRDADGVPLLDGDLLEQRAAFLRPDSVLGIVMLSNENDCSLRIGGQSWAVLQIDDTEPYFRGSRVCEQNPNDPCCYSCPDGPPEGCADDPVCAPDPATDMLVNRLPPLEDPENLRCFDQKRRFGVDWLYPVARYVNALTEPLLCAEAPDLALDGCAAPEPNPLFAGGRSPDDVFLAGIVGVPSSLIEANQNAPGRPPIENGFRYKLASELSAGDWTAMVGDASASPPVAPTVPFMVESALPRDGIPPGNAINGSESVSVLSNGAADELQYACIFELAEPRDCSQLDVSVDVCECYEPAAGTFQPPVCEERPGQRELGGTTQYWGMAYPGTRLLEVLRGVGARGVVSSICPRNTTQPDAPDFSYRPAIAALVDGMATRLPEAAAASPAAAAGAGGGP